MPKESTKSKSTHVESDDESGNDFNVIDCSDFKVDNLTLPPVDEKRSSDSQYHSFPVYKYGKKSDKLTLKTGPIKITKGGIPKLDDKWRRTDAKREFMWLGEDEEQENCKQLFTVLRDIDDHFNERISYDMDEKDDKNLETKTVFFQKDKKKVEPLTMLDYVPMVRLSVQGGNNEDKPDQPEYVPYKRCKLRFAKKYDKDRKEGEPSELTTALFLGDKEEPEELKYASDFEKYLRWNCTAQFVLQVSKFRCKRVIEKDKKGKQLPRECAFDINILQVIIVEEAPKSGMSNSDKYRKRMFPSGKASKPQVEAKKSTKEESSSESESEEEDKKKSTKEESSSESEDEKPKKVDKKVEKKEPVKKSKVVSSSESESESESESDSEDESEDEKPKAKPKHK
jgi:hypothetical protein